MTTLYYQCTRTPWRYLVSAGKTYHQLTQQPFFQLSRLQVSMCQYSPWRVFVAVTAVKLWALSRQDYQQILTFSGLRIHHQRLRFLQRSPLCNCVVLIIIAITCGQINLVIATSNEAPSDECVETFRYGTVGKIFCHCPFPSLNGI